MTDRKAPRSMPDWAFEFVDTKYAMAEDKVKATKSLVRFLDSGCPWTKFTNSLYNTVSDQLFGHIAHFDRSGFYHQWFKSPAGRLAFVEDMTRGGQYGILGDPHHTWSDVERYLRHWAKTSGIAERYRLELDTAIETHERIELARLQAKYPTPLLDSPLPPTSGMSLF